LGDLESTLSRAEEVFVAATSLANDQAWNEWQQLPAVARIAESELRNAVAKRVEHVATSNTLEDADPQSLDRFRSMDRNDASAPGEKQSSRSRIPNCNRSSMTEMNT